jgi:Sec-independent protein secretion pathway component TatC
MLWTIFVILVILWLLGMISGYVIGGFIHILLVIAIVAAAITPTTDALTMLVFMAPMILLYLLGIGVAALVVRGKKKRAQELSQEGAA